MEAKLRTGFCLVLALGFAQPLMAAEPTPEMVGVRDPQHIVVPVNQVLSPEGMQVELPGLRPQVLALSPDGSLLATSGKTADLVLVDPVQGTVVQKVSIPEVPSATKPDPDDEEEDQVSYTGLDYSPDGRRLYLSNVAGSIGVFDVAPDGTVKGLKAILLPPSGLKTREKDIPAGLAISSDGNKLYVALNLSNRLLELDLKTEKPTGTFDVGVAPYGVVLARSKVYVSNWGGRRPDDKSTTGPAGKGTRVRVDNVRYISSEGSVSVVDLKNRKVKKEILVGLHASAMALSPNGRSLVVANAGSDSLSVIDTRTDKVIETISLRWHPTDFFGASPNALTFDASGKTLYVCMGTQNAVGVVKFKPGKSKLAGLMPVGWYPGAIVHDAKQNKLYIANIKGTGSWSKKPEAQTKGYNSHQYFGTLSFLSIPSEKDLEKQTLVAQTNYRRAVEEAPQLPARPDRTPVPIPERTGEPSVFKHLVYIIKENRSYDQVLGDVVEGNGNASLCVFGKEVTPNQHKLVNDFVLLDNTYCSGILSADGHQWADTAFATDYMEKSFAGFPRSYPDGMDDDDVDALAYSPAGFLWDNVIAHGKTLRVYGEFATTEAGWKDKSKAGSPKFLDYYQDLKKGTGLTRISSRPSIESLRPYLCTTTVGWSLQIPDQFRADQFIQELKDFEAKGDLPNLMIICLPNDHTSGTGPGNPTPAAQVADNDLAFGRIVEAISHSKFWKDTCVFAIEDDPQNGWDHVSGYRTTAYVVSPYTKRHTVVHTNYNQTGLIRSIENILGLPPMNQMDATATPLSDCFMDKPDFSPYSVVPNRVPLDQMNPIKSAIKDRGQLRDAIASEKLPLDEPDRCPEDALNRILWRAQKGQKASYPLWAVTVIQKEDDEQ